MHIHSLIPSQVQFLFFFLQTRAARGPNKCRRFHPGIFVDFGVALPLPRHLINTPFPMQRKIKGGLDEMKSQRRDLGWRVTLIKRRLYYAWSRRLRLIAVWIFFLHGTQKERLKGNEGLRDFDIESGYLVRRYYQTDKQKVESTSLLEKKNVHSTVKCQRVMACAIYFFLCYATFYQEIQEIH